MCSFEGYFINVNRDQLNSPDDLESMAMQASTEKKSKPQDSQRKSKKHL